MSCPKCDRNTKYFKENGAIDWLMFSKCSGHLGVSIFLTEERVNFECEVISLRRHFYKKTLPVSYCPFCGEKLFED